MLFSYDGSDLPWSVGIPHVTEVSRQTRGYEVKGVGPVLAHVGAALIEHNIAPSDLRLERATLEDVFLQLTRDEAT